MKETTQKMRLLIAVLAVVVGLFMITVAPLLIQTSMERVIAALAEVSKEQPQFSSGVALFSLFYPIWRALIFMGGITLIVISRSIYQGKEWTYPAGLIASALPSSGGMFMFLPYISWVEGFPIPMIISWVGLVFFWGFIFLRKVSLLEKLAQFFTLTFIGMLTTHAFTIGIGCQRMLLTRPGKPLFQGVEWWILTWAGEVNWLAVVLLLVSIPLLAMKIRAGWWLAVIAALSILTIDIPTQIIRTKTLDYLYGSLLSLGLLVSLFIPRLKQALLAEGKMVDEGVLGEEQPSVHIPQTL